MNRLAASLSALRSSNRKALSLFVTAGYPSPDATTPLVVGLANAGADVIEIGIPFSDPIADGPTIQMSSETALRNGTTMATVLDIVSRIRKQTDIPLVLMGYSNPIFAYGLENFMAVVSSLGVDGTILADLPLEESDEYVSVAQRNRIAPIFLAAPTTPDARLRQLDDRSSGFLYCISVTGVTGARKDITGSAASFLRRARQCVKRNPLLIGFGISTPEDATSLSRLSDGVIIGSALITIMEQQRNGEGITRAAEFTRSIRRAIDA